MTLQVETFCGASDLQIFLRDTCLGDDVVELSLDGRRIGLVDSRGAGFRSHPGMTVKVSAQAGKHNLELRNVFSANRDGSGWFVSICQQDHTGAFAQPVTIPNVSRPARSRSRGLNPFPIPLDCTRVIDYFALGDSVASGHGLLDGGGDCRRSLSRTQGMVSDRLVELERFEHLACFGATTRGLRPQKDLPWQVTRVLEERRSGRCAVVSMTAGANDLPWADFETFYPGCAMRTKLASNSGWIRK